MALFEGVFAAAITPSRADRYEMDLGAALEVIDFLNASKVRGIALFGATGEFPHFTTDERIRLSHMAIMRSRIPVLVNASHSSFEASVSIAQEAIGNGAAGLMLMPPHFYRYPAVDIREFCLRFADEVGARVPILLYNLPLYTNGIPIEVATELMEQGVVAGIKDSSGDRAYLQQLLELKKRKAVAVMVGNDNLFTHGRMSGADGVISGCASAVPELLLAIDRALAAKNDTAIVNLTARLGEFIGWIEDFPGPNGVKEAVAVRGLKIGRRATPFAPAADRHVEEFREWFRGWLPVISKEAAAV